MAIKISAVVATYNREKYLPKALKSLVNQTLDKSEYEIIIVDNNSIDDTPNISKAFIENNKNVSCKYVIETNQGLSYGRNRGIKEAAGCYVTFIDDDAYLDKDFLKVCVEFFEANASVSAIGGIILLDYESKPPKWISKYLYPLFGYFNIGDKVKPFGKGNFPRGSNMTFVREVFDKYGLFDPNLGRIGKSLGAGEEKEFYNRLKEGNELIYYVPEALVYHAVPESRTSIDFIKRQAEGTGKSEWIRVSFEGKSSIYKRIAQELKKWIGSFVLFFFYLFSFRPSKGAMILRFRYWVSKAFIVSRKKNSNE